MTTRQNAPSVSSPPMTFALREGVVVHVDEVPNGLGCDCTCAGCGDALIARHGLVKAHGFSHQGGADCATGYESAVHKAVKQYLVANPRLLLPEHEERADEWDEEGQHWPVQKRLESQLVTFDSISEEVHLGDVVPDIVASFRGRELYVEVAVTHFVDENKLARLRKRGVAAIELDFSTSNDPWDWRSIGDLVERATYRKKWLYNPKFDSMRHAAERRARWSTAPTRVTLLLSVTASAEKRLIAGALVFPAYLIS